MKIKYQFPDSFFDEEDRIFRIDGETKTHWAALLDLLAEFDRVCRLNGINYSIDGGTLLGKIRHDGMIPWDDDIDVVILRKEYEKLIEVADDAFQEPYFLQTIQSDPEAVRGHPQLRNSSMTAILKSELKDGKAIYKHFNQGLFIDIFVLDAIPDNMDERKKFFSELTYLKQRMIRARNARRDRVPFGLSLKKIYYTIKAIWNKLEMLGVRLLVGKDPLVYYSTQFDRACKRYANIMTHDVSHILFLTNPPQNRIVEREKMLEMVDVNFEGIKVSMLKEWNYYLTLLYGDWHKYVIGKTMHEGVFVDLDNPYTKYF